MQLSRFFQVLNRPIQRGAVPAALTTSVLIVFLASGCSRGPVPFPPTEKRPVTEQYHGVTIIDNYQWLDNINEPAVRAWSDIQNAYARKYLDNLSSRQKILSRLQEISRGESPIYYGLVWKGGLFALKADPTKNQPVIVWMESPDSTKSERIVVDPYKLNPEGTTAIDWYVVSPDRRLLAVCLSENGSEDGSVNVFEAPGGRKLEDVVPRAQFPTGGGSLEWSPDGAGFYYTRYPQGKERPKEDWNFYQQVYFHKLGTSSAEDTYVVGKEFPSVAEVRISMSGDNKYMLVSVANGDGGEFAHYLRGPSGSWKQITQFSDNVVSVQFAPGDRSLYLLSRKNAPNGTILALPLSNPTLSAARTIVPEGKNAIAWFTSASNRLFVVYIDGGPMSVQVCSILGKEERRIALEPVASVDAIVGVGEGRVLYQTETYVDPPAWIEYDTETGVSTKSSLAPASSPAFADDEVVREFATSKDGTKIPINIIRRKSIIVDGQIPTILHGYGGYNINKTPAYDPFKRLWLEAGGVYAVGVLRGRGEYGETWHQQGKLMKKQNVFDDFVACAEYLLGNRYTNPSRLAIEGWSNGGLLMGATITQHPDLARAVVARMGIFDMVRSERFPNGAFNVTEFGSVKDPSQFQALYAYSPYHHVEDGKAYPAVLFLTGDNDGRVDPSNSRKMVGRMQAASSSGLPILLTSNPHMGHGYGTRWGDRVAQEADVYSFLFDQLRVTVR
jgi:prolyl oligopeptidase